MKTLLLFAFVASLVLPIGPTGAYGSSLRVQLGAGGVQPIDLVSNTLFLSIENGLTVGNFRITGAHVDGIDGGTVNKISLTGATITNTAARNSPPDTLRIVFEGAFFPIKVNGPQFWGASLSGQFIRRPVSNANLVSNANPDTIIMESVGGFLSSSSLGNVIQQNPIGRLKYRVKPGSLSYNKFDPPNPPQQTATFSCSVSGCQPSGIYLKGVLDITLNGQDQVTLPNSAFICRSQTAAACQKALAAEARLKGR